MNLNSFVSQYRGRWHELEQAVTVLESNSAAGQDLGRLRRFAQLYRQATDDLALARTFFADSNVCQYLNALVAQAHPLLYGRPRQRPLAAIGRYFSRDFPRAFREARVTIIVAAGLLFLPMLVGYLATLDHDGLARAFLPEGMTQSVDSGELWMEAHFIYTPGEVISTQLMLNNITVTFLTFAGGVVAGLGTIYVLILNGLLLGCAAGYVQRGGLTGEFWSFVVGHGFLELFVICMAGGAGLQLGLALVSPGQLPRGQAIRERGRRAVRLIVGGVPLLVIAGIIEGMVSGGPAIWLVGTMDLGKMLLGMLVLGVVLWYLLSFGRSATSGQWGLSLAERAALRIGADDQSRPRCLISR